MSHKHPTPGQLRENSTGKYPEIPVCKDYMNLAGKVFFQKHGRGYTLDDSQEIRDLIEEQWHDHYIGKPARVKANREKTKEVWRYAITYRLDVYNALCRYLEYKYSEWTLKPQNTFGLKQFPVKSAGDLMKEMDIEFTDGHIIDNNLLNDWKDFIDTHHGELRKYTRPVYRDYSHLAYSGVTDDL